MTRRRAMLLCSFLLVAAACGEGPRNEIGTGVLSVGPATSTSGDPTLGDGDDTVGIRLDLATLEDLPVEDVCRAIDFLFVIDSSTSMEEHQSALKAAFPAFIDTITSTLPMTDYHIMVVDTDADGRCSPEACTHFTCQADGQYACGAWFVPCDRTLGAGVVHPAGVAASNRLCVIAGNRRYLRRGQNDLVGTFECIASVGVAGSASERPIDSMVAAVSPELLAVDSCNTGFVRDEALLVITFLSDDPNLEDETTPDAAYEALVAAKHGNPEAIVMLGLIPAGQSHWTNLIARFGERGIEGPIDALDYNEFFLDRVQLIANACLELAG
jgi:hypothetical protein